MITYDNCRTWERLHHNEKVINLHSYSSYLFYDIPPIATNNYGTLIANGNVGEYLKYEKEGISTYVSKNAGKTLKEVIFI
jgi:hypothetical protein